jgi:hypothetical protein
VKFCSQCGAPLEVSDRFCQSCGAPVSGTSAIQSQSDTETATAVTAVAPLGGAPVVPGRPANPTAPSMQPDPPMPGTPALQPPRGLPRPSRKLVIISSVVVVLVAVVLSGLLIVQNLLRGGAGSPEQAVSKVIDSVSHNDLVGLYTMITPREREAVKRTQDAFVKKYEEFGLADAAKALSSKDLTTAELSFEGVTVSVVGTHPRVEELSDDLAVVTLDTGELKWSINPAKAKGIIRAQLDAVKVTKKTSGSVFFGEAADGQGVTLMATRVDGRWYISPLLSALDAVNTAAGQTRGTVPASFQKGSLTPVAAAEAAASVVPRITKDGLKALAPYVSIEEAEALYLYGDSVPAINGTSVTLGGVRFTPGPQDGDRAKAYVGGIEFRVNAGSKIALTSTCVSQQGQEKMCLNGSGFLGSSSSYLAGGTLSYLADQGKFALTSVKENGAWKVSILDTAADHAISWVNSITKEQALATLGWERVDESSGTLSLGTKSTVKYNSAGYSVMKLDLTEAMKIELSDSSEAYGQIYDTEGKNLGSISAGYGTDELPAGAYTLVLNGGSAWAETFAEQGNKVAFSSSVMIEKYIEPPTIDGSEEPASGTVYSGSGDEVYEALIPEGNSADLMLKVSDADSDDADGAITVSVDNDSVISFDARRGSSNVIPYPDDAQPHTVRVWITASPEGWFAVADFSLSFESK